MKALTDSEIRAERLRREIAQLEARYDGLFPPGVYSVLEGLKLKLIELGVTPPGLSRPGSTPALYPGGSPESA